MSYVCLGLNAKTQLRNELKGFYKTGNIQLQITISGANLKHLIANDIDGDGEVEIIVNDAGNGYTYYIAPDGTIKVKITSCLYRLASCPNRLCGVTSSEIKIYDGSGNFIRSRVVDLVAYKDGGIATGDVDKDGEDEFIVWTGDYLYIIDKDNLLEVSISMSGSRYFDCPAYDDIDGDGVIEIINVVCDSAVNVYCVKADGTVVWQVQPTSDYQGSSTIADDGNIIFASGDTGRMYVLDKSDGSTLRYVDYTGDRVYPQYGSGFDGSRIFRGTYDGDGVYCLAYSDLSTLWQYNLNGSTADRVLLQIANDVDDDGSYEVVFTCAYYSTSSIAGLYVVDDDGSLIWDDLDPDCDDRNIFVWDIDNDDKAELIVVHLHSADELLIYKDKVLEQECTETFYASDVIAKSILAIRSETLINKDVLIKNTERWLSDLFKVSDILERNPIKIPKEIIYSSDRISAKTTWLNETLKAITTSLHDVLEMGMPTIFTQVLTDSFLSKDILLKSTSKTFKETFISKDYITKLPLKLIKDVFKVKDYISKAILHILKDIFKVKDYITKIMSRLLSEAFIVKDYIFKYSVRLCSEVFTCIDTLAKFITHILSDRFIVKDYISKSTLHIITDIFKVKDVISKSVLRILKETFKGIDKITKFITIIKTDVVKFVDVISKTSIKLCTEIFTCKDYITKFTTRMLVDVIKFTDIIIKSTFRVLSDVFKLTDLAITRFVTKLLEEIFITRDYISKSIFTIKTEVVLLKDFITKMTLKLLKEVIYYKDFIAKFITKLLTDIFKIFDFIYKSTFRTLPSETFIIKDYIIKIPVKVLHDVTIFKDYITRLVLKVLTEILTFIDVLNKFTLRTISEVFIVKDVISKFVIRTLKELLTFKDYIAKFITKLVTEIAKFIDRISAKTVWLNETLKNVTTSLHDVLMMGMPTVFTQILTEIFTTKDVVTKTITRTIKETFIVKDYIAKIVTKTLTEVSKFIDLSINKFLAKTLTEVAIAKDYIIKSTLTIKDEIIYLKDVLAKTTIKTFKEVTYYKDVVSKAIIKVLIDTFKVIDYLFKLIFRTLPSEVIIIKDYIIKTSIKLLSEIVLFKDIINKVAIKLIVEVVTFIDKVSKFITILVSEIVVVKDIISKSTTRLLEEIVLVKDFITKTCIKVATEVVKFKDKISARTIWLNETLKAITTSLHDVLCAYIPATFLKVLTETTIVKDVIVKSSRKTFEEVYKVTDYITKLPQKILTEIITFKEVFVKFISKTLTEIITFKDILMKVTIRTLIEIMKVSDVLRLLPIKILDEIVYVKEVFSKSITKTFVEVVGLKDVLMKSMLRILVEITIFKEVFIKIITKIHTELIILKDKLSARTVWINETLRAITSSTQRLIGIIPLFVQILSETFVSIDKVSKSISRTFTEKLIIKDIVTKALSRTFTEFIKFKDFVIKTAIKIFSDITKLSDRLSARTIWLNETLKAITTSTQRLIGVLGIFAQILSETFITVDKISKSISKTFIEKINVKDVFAKIIVKTFVEVIKLKDILSYYLTKVLSEVLLLKERLSARTVWLNETLKNVTTALHDVFKVFMPATFVKELKETFIMRKIYLSPSIFMDFIKFKDKLIITTTWVNETLKSVTTSLHDILKLQMPKIILRVLVLARDMVDKFRPYHHNWHVDNWKRQIEANKFIRDIFNIKDITLDFYISQLEDIVSQMRYVQRGQPYYARDHNLFVDAWKVQNEINKRFIELIKDVPQEAINLVNEIDKLVSQMKYITSGEIYYAKYYNVFKYAWDKQRKLNIVLRI